MDSSTSQSSTPVTYAHAGRFRGTDPVPFHTHIGTEHILVTSGECSIVYNDKVLRGAKGMLFVIPAGARHNQINHGDTATTYFSCIGSQGTVHSRFRTVDIGAERWIGQWMEQISDLVRTASGVSRGVLDGLAQAIVYRVRDMERAPGHRPLHPALAEAVDALDREPGHPHTVEGLARRVAVSPGYLTVLFRQHFGLGPMHYLQRQRMELARRLLADPYLTIAQVSAHCGYDDPNYFSRLFKRVHGATPGAERRRIQS